MYKSFVDFFKIRTNISEAVFTKLQSMFVRIVSAVVGVALVCFGLVSAFFLNDPTWYTMALMLIGILLFIIFYLSHTGKLSPPMLAYISLCLPIVGMVIMLALGDIVYFHMLVILFAVLSCILLRVMVGSIIAAVAVAIGVTVGILYSDNTQLHIMICLVGTIVLLCVRGLVLISIKLIVDIASMHKSEEINNNFASQLSHQIRTPLNNIVLIGSLLNQTNLTSRQKDWLETIIASANNLATVVNVFSSSLSAVRTEDEKINNVSFKIHTVLDSIIQAYVGQSEDYNIGIKPIMEEQHLLKGNPIQIKQIFMNLIDTIINNRKVDKINIIISYNVKQETNNLFNISFEVRVTDLFDLSAQSVENSGEMFNFSVAKKLIAMTGSELNVEVTDKYTMFTFSLSFERSQQTDTPDVTDISHKKLDTESNSIFQDTSKVDLKAANVLLVEDNLINQRIVVLSIRKLVKNIDIANNGLEAVEKFNQTGYNIILMDLQMPLMDGIQATKKIREIESEKQTIPTPIIAITANALTGDREHCLASGMDDYLPKPFQVEMLVAKMKNLLAS